jgi:hypothetical protein
MLLAVRVRSMSDYENGRRVPDLDELSLAVEVRV